MTTSAKIPSPSSQPLSGWGRQPTEQCDVYRPRDFTMLQEIVARATQPTLTPRGLGRSYGDAALNATGAVILSQRLDRMQHFDPANATIDCEAGVSLADLLEHLLPRGFFFPVTPGTKFISLGGAIAADVHGKNHHSSGSMSAWLDRFRLLTAKGEILECSREENTEAFWATVGGMGLTGMILDARIRLRLVETASMVAEYERVPQLDALLEKMDARDAEFDYAVAWIDTLASGQSTGRSVLMRANHARLDELPEAQRADPLRDRRRRSFSVPFDFPSWTLNRLSMRIFNEALHARYRNETRLVSCDAYFYPLDSVGAWNRFYGARGVLQYQVVLPEETARTALTRILETLHAEGCSSFLSVLKSLGPASQGLLSFPQRGKTLALDLPYTGEALVGTLNRLDRIVAGAGGRVYLAKDACLDRALFSEMYPRLDAFRAIREVLDPDGRFSSSLARRLGITEAS